MLAVEYPIADQQLQYQYHDKGQSYLLLTLAITKWLQDCRSPNSGYYCANLCRIIYLSVFNSQRKAKDKHHHECRMFDDCKLQFGAYVVETAPVEDKIAECQSNHPKYVQCSTRSHPKPIFQLITSYKRYEVATHSTKYTYDQCSQRSEGVLDCGRKNYSGEDAACYLHKAKMKKVCSYQSVEVSLSHPRTVISTHLHQPIPAYLQEFALPVETSGHFKCEDKDICGHKQGGDRDDGEGRAKVIHKHLKVGFLSWVLEWWPA